MKRILLCSMMPLIVFCSTQNLTGVNPDVVQQKESVMFEASEFFINDSNNDSILPIDPVALNFSVQSNDTQKETINASSTVVKQEPVKNNEKNEPSENPVKETDKPETKHEESEKEEQEPENTQPDIKYYNVPLTDKQQRYAIEVCEKYNVDVKLVFAMMSVESTYNPNSVNGNCYGILQINKIHLKNLKKKLGVTEIKSYENNVLCGVYMISKYLNKYDDTHKALISYNCGEGNAAKLFAKDIFKTSYSKKVVSRMKNIKFK